MAQVGRHRDRRLASPLASSPSRSRRRSRSRSSPTRATPSAGTRCLPLSAQNILVLGTDVRSDDFGGAEEPSPRSAWSRPRAARPPRRARQAPAPTRSWSFGPAAARSRSSRSRATRWPRSPATATSKINAAYAFGGAELQIKTVEDLLGIDINHIAIVDFAGFQRPHRLGRRGQGRPRSPASATRSRAARSASTSGPGEETLSGDKALALARTRTTTCGEPTIDDLDRASSSS